MTVIQVPHLDKLLDRLCQLEVRSSHLVIDCTVVVGIATQSSSLVHEEPVDAQLHVTLIVEDINSSPSGQTNVLLVVLLYLPDMDHMFHLVGEQLKLTIHFQSGLLRCQCVFGIVDVQMNVLVLDCDCKCVIGMAMASQGVLALGAQVMLKLQRVKCDEMSIENVTDSYRLQKSSMKPILNHDRRKDLRFLSGRGKT